MLYRPVIRQFLAGFLLLVFAFSITPRQSLHDLLANHRDNANAPVSNGKAVLTVAGFNCDCDNLVAESPFTGWYASLNLTVPSVFIPRPAFQPHSFYSFTHIFFSLRGPPREQLA